jgi:hypothetical protein
MSTLKISARNAGKVELAKYCPRCAWYLLRIKSWPFQFGMPGVMFYLEQVQKAFILSYLDKHEKLPDSFGPFSDCTHPVEFPFRMEALHEDTDVLVTAQVDMMLRKPSKNICLLDLKTSRVGGGGDVFVPQYEIQTIGYSWVTEATNLGRVEMTGLVYCEIQHDLFKDDPLSFSDEDGIFVPFHFTPHEVELDYKRFAKCLKEMNRLWKEPHPPRGAENCKDCVLLNRIFDFESDLRKRDALTVTVFPQLREMLWSHEYDRMLARGNLRQMQDALIQPPRWDEDGGMWANWDFS